MAEDVQYEYILIRDAAILVRVPRGGTENEEVAPEFFDVRTGVQLKRIHPPLQPQELTRGYPLSKEAAAAIVSEGAPFGIELEVDLSKVISIQEVKQRRLDSVVADSILDQLRIISDLLRKFLSAADAADREKRFWMSQQILTVVRKFSGRELEELEEMVEWLSRPRNK